jgi:predicted PurR-regulated permease PerM
MGAPPPSAGSRSGFGNRRARALDGRRHQLEGRSKPAALTATGLRTAADYAWRLLVVAAAIVAVAWLIMQLRPIVIATIFSLFLTALLAPAVGQLADRTPLGKGFASFVVLMGFLAGVAFVGYLVIPPFGEQLGELGSQLEEAVDEGERWLIEGPLDLTEDEVGRYIDQAGDQLQDNSGGLASGVLGGALLILEILGALVIGLVATFFLLRDGPSIWTWMVSLFSPRVREDFDEMGRRSWRVVGAYLRGVALVATVDAVLIGVALALLGVPAALPLAVLTFFGAFIPFVGATVAGAIATTVALVANGVEVALVVLVVIIVVQQLEGDFLYPVVVGRSVQLHPLVTIIAILAGGTLAGIIGAIVAIPIAAAIAQAIEFSREKQARARAEALEAGPPTGVSPANP